MRVMDWVMCSACLLVEGAVAFFQHGEARGFRPRGSSRRRLALGLRESFDCRDPGIRAGTRGGYVAHIVGADGKKVHDEARQKSGPGRPSGRPLQERLSGVGRFASRMRPMRPPGPRALPVIGLLQRVSRARVEIGADTAGAVGHGPMMLVGVERGDTERGPVRARFR